MIYLSSFIPVRLLRGLLIAALAAGLVVGIAGPAGAPTRAQAGGSWSAWIYHEESGRLVHVFPDGLPPQSMDFPLPPGTSQPPATITFSRDGAYLAACLIDDAGNYSVRVYDVYNRTYIAAWLASGPLMACSLDRYSFNPDGSQLAFGVLNHWPGDSDPRPAWEVYVLEMHTSAIRHHLTADSPAVTAFGERYQGTLPMIVDFQRVNPTVPGLIAFRLVPWGTEGAPEYDSFVWNLSTGSLNDSDLYGKASLELLMPTGEGTWVAVDERFPQGTLIGPGVPFNVVMYAPPSGERYPIYTGDSMVLGSATFIDDGRRIAVSSYSGDGSVRRWHAVARNGSVTPLPNDLETYQVWGTLDGYVFLNNPAGPGGIPEVHYHRFEGGTIPASYIAWTGAPDEYWRMVWVNPLTGGTGLPSFSPLGIVGPPPVMTPTPTGSDPGTSIGPLTVGMQVEVNTTEGDLLRVRAAPGLSGAVLFSLPDGTRVTLTEGPVRMDGLNWWRVTTGDGRSGWAVDGVWDGGTWLNTLIPWPSGGGIGG